LDIETAGVFCQQDNQVIRLVHYSDKQHNAGKFRRMLLNKDEIVRTSLLFIPGKIDCL
jgi:hypothetical protein